MNTTPPPVSDGISPAIRRRNAARVAAVQTLYRLAVNSDAASAVSAMDDYLTQLEEDKSDPLDEESLQLEPDVAFFRKVVEAAWENREALDGALRPFLTSGWREERTPATLRAIFRAALAELLRLRTAPAPIIINEYLHITRAFFGDSEVKFVNGALDAVVKAEAAPKAPPAE